MSNRILSWSGVGLALLTAGAAAHLTAAQQQMIVTSDTRTVGPVGLAGGLPPGQPLIAGTGLIMGQAIDAATRRPVGDALITLSVSGYLPAIVLADAEGRFVFPSLPKGRFSITATRPGYADGAYGRLRPSGPTVSLELAADQRVGDVSIPLWKLGSIGGTVLDENNDPMVGVTVRLLRRTIVAGKRQLQPGPSDTTDDRGIYRVSQLEPGEYIVVVPMAQPSSNLDSLLSRLAGAAGGGGMSFAVSGSAGGGSSSSMSLQMSDNSNSADGSAAGITEDGHILAYPTLFYPTAASPQRATAVVLASGDERPSVDFQMRPVRTVRVSGTVIGVDGPAANLSVSLMPSDADDLLSPVGMPSATTDATGHFTFGAVAPGSYTLRTTKGAGGGDGSTVMTRTANGGMMVTRSIMMSADGSQPPLPTDSVQWAEVGVPVGQSDVNELSVGLRQAVRTSGILAFQGGTQKPDASKLSSISVSLEAADGRTALAGATARGRVDPNGTFQTMGVVPGKYIVRVSGAPDGWSFLGAMLGGRDVSSEPIEITSSEITGIALTFTDKPAEVGGLVTTSNGAPDAGAAVIVFPTEPDAWVGRGSSPRRIRNTRAAKDGSYTIANLPPGRYFLAAVNDAVAPDWQDSKFLELLSRSALRIDVAEGEKKKQTIQTTVVR